MSDRGKMRTLDDYPPPEDVMAMYMGGVRDTRCAECGLPAPVQDNGSRETAEALGAEGWTMCGIEHGQTVILCPECWAEYWQGVAE